MTTTAKQITLLLPFLLLVLLLSSYTNAAQVIPGLELFPADVTCCPTVPLVGPVWLVDTSSLPLNNINDECSFVPAPSRPMVFVFQPNGIVNGFTDVNACHYFHGNYQLKGSTSQSSYNYEFHWNRWKSQPYSCLSIHCGTNDNDIDIFWTRITASVTNLVITGYTNIELRDSNGQVVVRLEALSNSYSCDATTELQKQQLCDTVLEIPKLTSSITNTLMEYTPDELATGGGGLSVPEANYDIEKVNHGGSDATTEETPEDRLGGEDTDASNKIKAFFSWSTRTLVIVLFSAGMLVWFLVACLLWRGRRRFLHANPIPHNASMVSRRGSFSQENQTFETTAILT